MRAFNLLFGEKKSAKDFFLEGKKFIDREAYRAAIPKLDKAISLLNPQNSYKDIPYESKEILAESFEYRGNAKARLHDYEGAIQDYDEAIKLKPNWISPYISRG